MHGSAKPVLLASKFFRPALPPQQVARDHLVARLNVGYLATRTPEIETPEFTYGGEDAMDKRVLVTYATRAGSTAEVAAAIGESLGE